MQVHLKMKLMSLAAEGRIIRDEESRMKYKARKWALKAKQAAARKTSDIRESLHEHRVRVVRPEARASHLAYGFLRGLEYVQMEQKAYTKPDWERVERIVTKFGEGDVRDVKQKLAEWMPSES